METFNGNGYKVARFRIKNSDCNYNYILWCVETNKCVVIDPIDPVLLLNFIRENDLKVAYVINTHAHPDHISGNDPIIKVFLSSKILIHKNASDRVSPRSDTIDEGDQVSFGKQKLDVIFTPGHAPEHICLIIGDHIFVGDTLFLAGCGNTKFRGNAIDLFESLTYKLKVLPENLRILCGHDYAEKNLMFSIKVEPENKFAINKLESIKKLKSENKAPEPTSIGEELTYNPFLRLDKSAIIKFVNKINPEIGNNQDLIFKELRELRNNW